MSTSDHDTQFADFFREHDRRLRGYLAKTVGAPPDLVDEVAPFAFMAVRRHWERLRHESPKAYLFVVGHRKALERLGTDRYRRELANTDKFDQVTTEVAGPPSQVEGLIDRLTLEKLVQHLPPSLRQAVALRHILGFSIAETAAIMNVKPGTVKRYTFDGLQELRGLIASEADTGEVDDR